MTASLLEIAPTAAHAHGVRPRDPRRARAGADPRNAGPASTLWRAHAAACTDGRLPAQSAPALTGRLYWTPRGVAVMVCVVFALVALMSATLLVAFLGVSNAPIDVAPSGPAVVSTSVHAAA